MTEKKREERNTSILFIFNDTATTEIYTLSLHDALPIYLDRIDDREAILRPIIDAKPQTRPGKLLSYHAVSGGFILAEVIEDRKSTRLNFSHANISYAVFCLKKKISPFFPSTYLIYFSFA